MVMNNAGDTLDIVTAGEKASVEADRMISDIYGKDSKMTKGTNIWRFCRNGHRYKLY